MSSEITEQTEKTGSALVSSACLPQCEFSKICARDERAPSFFRLFRNLSSIFLIWLSLLCTGLAQEQSATWHREEGIRQLQKRDAQKALDHFRAAARIDPQDAQSRFYIGAILVDSGEPVDAVSELQKSIELNQKLHLAHYYLAMAFDRLGKT